MVKFADILSGIMDKISRQNSEEKALDFHSRLEFNEKLKEAGLSIEEIRRLYELKDKIADCRDEIDLIFEKIENKRKK